MPPGLFSSMLRTAFQPCRHPESLISEKLEFLLAAVSFSTSQKPAV